MTGPITTSLEVIAGELSGVPAPVRTSFLKALSDLLGGLTAIPAAKLKQYAQGIEDTTAARSIASATLARAAADGAIKDPALLQAAAEVYLPTNLRKARNRLGVAERAAEHISASTAGPELSDAAPPEDDWMNSFMRFAEDASSEKLQDLFGRILAGQVARPGSFSPKTLRAVSELDQSTASDFTAMWSQSVGIAVDFDSTLQIGDGFSRWKRLAEAGLMAPSDTAQFLPDYRPLIGDAALWSPMTAGDTYLLVYFPQNCQARWIHIDFTRVGQELGTLLERPDYEGNMRKAGLRLAEQGVSRVELHSPGRPMELLFPAE